MFTISHTIRYFFHLISLINLNHLINLIKFFVQQKKEHNFSPPIIPNLHHLNKALTPTTSPTSSYHLPPNPTSSPTHQPRFTVRHKIGPFAQPDFLQEAPGLPKTRSGKIMRRVLRKIAVGDRDLGDISTMADESVVDMLFGLRPQGS